MPKVEIDYSNTIFYKIFCKDSAVKDLYVGLTTNFVQRRHAHKQSCKNIKAPNHNCKLYSAIRNAGGWDNWQMEIIAFHKCKDSYEAHKKEQEYFETLGATLNSIEPLPKPKVKGPIMKTVKERPKLLCDQCNVDLPHWKTEGDHIHNGKTSKPAYYCKQCNYLCYVKFSYDRHILTSKHIQRSQNETKIEKNEKPDATHICECGQAYNSRTTMWRHRKNCVVIKQHNETPIKNTESNKDELINYLMKENQEFKSLILKIVQNSIGAQGVTKNAPDLDQYNKIIVDSIGGSDKNVIVDKGPSL